MKNRGRCAGHEEENSDRDGEIQDNNKHASGFRKFFKNNNAIYTNRNNAKKSNTIVQRCEAARTLNL